MMLRPGDSTSVSELVAGACADAEAFANTVATMGDDAPAVVAAVDLGVRLESEAAIGESGLVDLRAYRGHVTGDTGGAWVDNTTILTAATLMSEAGPAALTPLTLWDLVTFFDAVVGYERIYHHAHPGIDDLDLNRCLGGRIFRAVPLPLQEPGTAEILPDPWEGAHRFMCDVWDQGYNWLKRLASNERPDTLDGEQLAAVLDAWAHALDRPDLKAAEILDWEAISEVWQSPSDVLLRRMVDVTALDDSGVWVDPRPGQQELAELHSELGLPPKPSPRARLLTELNLRAYTNQRMADFFGLAYVPGTGRVPFRRHLYNRALAVQHRLQAVELLDRRYDEIAGEVRLRLPIFLAIAVRQAKRPEQLWDVLADLRGEARPYREVRWKLDAALADEDLKEARRLAKALNTSVDSVLAVAGEAVAGAGVAAVAEMAKGDLSGIAAATAAVQAASAKLLDSSVADRLLWRLRRPHLLWFNNVMDEAERLTEALPAVAKLWGVPEMEKERFVVRFQKMGELQR